MFAINIENLKKSNISYIFEKNILKVFLLFIVSVVMNMKKYF